MPDFDPRLFFQDPHDPNYAGASIDLATAAQDLQTRRVIQQRQQVALEEEQRQAKWYKDLDESAREHLPGILGGGPAQPHLSPAEIAKAGGSPPDPGQSESDTGRPSLKGTGRASTNNAGAATEDQSQPYHASSGYTAQAPAPAETPVSIASTIGPDTVQPGVGMFPGPGGKGWGDRQTIQQISPNAVADSVAPAPFNPDPTHYEDYRNQPPAPLTSYTRPSFGEMMGAQPSNAVPGSEAPPQQNAPVGISEYLTPNERPVLRRAPVSAAPPATAPAAVPPARPAPAASATPVAATPPPAAVQPPAADAGVPYGSSSSGASRSVYLDYVDRMTRSMMSKGHAGQALAWRAAKLKEYDTEVKLKADGNEAANKAEASRHVLAADAMKLFQASPPALRAQRWGGFIAEQIRSGHITDAEVDGNGIRQYPGDAALPMIELAFRGQAAANLDAVRMGTARAAEQKLATDKANAPAIARKDIADASKAESDAEEKQRSLNAATLRQAAREGPNEYLAALNALPVEQRKAFPKTYAPATIDEDVLVAGMNAQQLAGHLDRKATAAETKTRDANSTADRKSSQDIARDRNAILRENKGKADKRRFTAIQTKMDDRMKEAERQYQVNIAKANKDDDAIAAAKEARRRAVQAAQYAYENEITAETGEPVPHSTWADEDTTTSATKSATPAQKTKRKPLADIFGAKH